ncbi:MULTISPECIES: hypothetical protein [unclassified Lysinibacillus]|uniref:hypothetical protein n=1 Tax=unclassified Lysinibacillus TaxID=2636778 RepID=UPI00143DD989|nr:MULTISPECIES: hypothetical protein [unclassified Lysinibacillus]
MIITETWWGEIFSGPLSIGVNEQKLAQLEDESFLYFDELTATTLNDEQNT